MINRRAAVALLVLMAPLAACVTGSDSSTASSFQAKFEPLDGIMPFPNDLYFNGSTTGTLNIPAGTAGSAADAPLLELNHLDGFGTESDINIFFNEKVDASTLAANVLVFKVTSDPTTKGINPPAPAGTGSMTPLVVGTDYSIALSPGTDSGGEEVTIKPLHPLAPSSGITGPSTYLVVVTTGVKNTSGAAVTPSTDYAAIVAADAPVLTGGSMGTTGNASLDQVALFTLPQIIDAAGAGVNPANIALTFSFSTAYLQVGLAELAASATATAQPAGVGIVDTGLTVCDALGLSSNCSLAPGSANAEVYAGTVALPYYLTVPATGSKAALADFWHGSVHGGDTTILDPLPAVTVAQNVIPILVSIPTACGSVPSGGWPVAIFQHGITQNRENLFAIAGTFASACMAAVAIDLPLHGVTNTSDPLYAGPFERTFNMDATGAAGATGSAIDGSGAWFINLNSTITSRDNLREGAADLINLSVTLPTLAAIGANTNTFSSTKMFFVGHSLGGIVGGTFLGADSAGAQLASRSPRITAAVLANPGGHIAELLRNSAEFEPIIDAQLAAAGLAKGTQAYYDFYSEAQAVVEDGDPANYIAAASAGHLIHMLEVVGGLDAASLPDQVVPNSATDVLIAQMGITTPVSSAGPHAIAVGAPTLAQFISGDHGSLLSPSAPNGASTADQAAYAAVTTEMQSEVGNLFGSILLGSPAVVVSSNTYLSATLKQ